MNSRKLGTRWGIQLTTRLWDLIQKYWNNRHNIFHETHALDKLSDIVKLRSSINSELEIGLGELPYVYTTYFLHPLARLLFKPENT